MAVWLCRAGRLGEYEARFLEDGKIFYTFQEIDRPLTDFPTKKDLQAFFLSLPSPAKKNAARVYAGQGFAFCHEMSVGDWIITPSKTAPGILRFAEIVGDYEYIPDAEESYRHARPVRWFANLARNLFDADTLASLGAFMTICKIKQEERIKKVVKNPQNAGFSEVSTLSPRKNLEAESLDEISAFLIHNFKGHGLTRVIEAILRAKGYVVYRSEEGPDHGVDLLASAGSLGFGSPKICVQVKSAEDAVERVVLDQLLGTMANVGADYGLLVSWGGFKKSILRDVPMQFFKVRLWTRIDILNELLQCYDALDEQIKQEIPLRRIWVLGNEEDGEA